MAHHIYEIVTDYPCPRCGGNKAIVSVFHFGVTHKPACSICGLGPKYGDHEDAAKMHLHKSYFEYAETHSINMQEL